MDSDLAESVDALKQAFDRRHVPIQLGRADPALVDELKAKLGITRRYRDFLLDASGSRGWPIGAAVTTLFVEGTPHERGEVDPSAPKRPEPPLTEHPLVKHYGLPLEALAT